MLSQLSPENSNSICFPRLVDVRNFLPTRFSWSARVFVPRNTYLPVRTPTSTISSPRPASHCFRNHSTSANSGIAQITRAIVAIKGGSATPLRDIKIAQLRRHWLTSRSPRRRLLDPPPVGAIARRAKFTHGEGDHH